MATLVSNFTDEPEKMSVIPSMIGFNHKEFKIMLGEKCKRYSPEWIEKQVHFNPGRIHELLYRKRTEFSFIEFKALNRLFEFY